MDDVKDAPIQEPDVTSQFTAGERALRDLFVKEYLVDYDALAAAIRCGYPHTFAKEYSIRFMQCPYVLREIRAKQVSEEDQESPEAMKKIIMAGLMREANYRGPGSSQAARVAAFAKLASIHGMDAPIRSKTELTGADGQPLNAGGGLFVVPGLMSVEEWEAKAAAQQEELTRDTADNVVKLTVVNG
jgi:hypothetical protein